MSSEARAHGAAHLAHHFDTPEQQKASATLGMWAFLVTEVMFFGGLFAVYATYRTLYHDGFVAGSRELDILPLDADDIAACEPVYETFPGWSGTTAGVTQWDKLPANARRYLERVQALIGVPIDMVFTGPDREHTILLRHPYAA